MHVIFELYFVSPNIDRVLAGTSGFRKNATNELFCITTN